MSADRVRRRELIGIVISDKMAKTVVVQVTRLTRHPKYEKVIRRYSNYKVHDEESKAKEGDHVRIVGTRSLSKDKRWRLAEVTKKALTPHPVEGLS